MPEYSDYKEDCHACSLRETCVAVTRGRGFLTAPLLVVGSAPDPVSHATENAFDPGGEPGKRLLWLLDVLELSPDQARLTYAVACLPPLCFSRRLIPAIALKTCRTWLDMEIAAMIAARQEQEEPPPFVVTLGAVAMESFLETPPGTSPCEGMGHAFISPRFPDLDCFPLYDFETLEKGIRTALIEEEWETAIARLRASLVFAEVIPYANPAEPHPWPPCEGLYKRFLPCRCDEVFAQIRERKIAPRKVDWEEDERTGRRWPLKIKTGT